MKRVKFPSQCSFHVPSQIFSLEGLHLTVTFSSWCSLSVFLRVDMRGALSFTVLVVLRVVVLWLWRYAGHGLQVGQLKLGRLSWVVALGVGVEVREKEREERSGQNKSQRCCYYYFWITLIYDFAIKIRFSTFGMNSP